MDTCYQSAMRYLDEFGLPVIPVGVRFNKTKGKYDKFPLIEWKPYQDRLPTKEEVKQWFEKTNAQIGIVCGEMSNLLVVDFDFYKMSEDEKKNASALLPENLVTPTVQTISGGQHFWFNYPPGKKFKPKQSIRPHVDLLAQGSFTMAPPSSDGKGHDYKFLVEYCKEGKADIPTNILNIINNNNTIPREKDAAPYQSLNTLINLNLLTEEGVRDGRIFHIAHCMTRGGLEPAYSCEVLESLYEKLNQNSVSPYSKEEIRRKIQSAFDRKEQKERNLTGEIKTWINLNDLNFSLKDLKGDLKILNSSDANILYVTIKTLCNQGVIEKFGVTPGIYRKKETLVNFVDISQAEDLTYFDLKWPLNVQDYVGVSAKSISVIAGETEAGKSAFLTNFCYLNLDKHKILYFSSEMTPSRFKKRVSTLPRPLGDWKKLLFTTDKSADFHDTIDPDAINVIDYLELDPGRVFDVATYLKRIFEKLNKGIAIVALQKKRGEDLAYGRDWTMQKSEFYMTISRIEGENIAKIEKSKNWVNSRVNPVGLKRKFYIVDGVKFIQHKMRPDWFKNEGNKEEDYL